MAFCTNCGSEVQGQFCGSCGQRAGASVSGAATAGGLSDNVAGLLCYIPGLIAPIVFLVIEPYKRNRFVRFHAFQSIFLSLAWFAVSFAYNFISEVAGSISWRLFSVLDHIFPIVGLGFGVVVVVAMVKTYQGERWKLPVIGEYAEKQA
jgi:uncharacterized membrane protein